MFQTRLRELREAAGYKSQQAFANAFGVAQSTVGGWESGKREPNYETTVRLSRFFGVPVGYLLGTESKDEYSIIFRQRLSEELAAIEPPCTEEGDYDYYQLLDMTDKSSPLSLAEACDAADKVGCSMSYMLQEIDEDIVRNPVESKETPTPETEDGLDAELVQRLMELTPEELAKVDAFVQGLLAAR